jgi:hypothetical protein
MIIAPRAYSAIRAAHPERAEASAAPNAALGLSFNVTSM